MQSVTQPSKSLGSVINNFVSYLLLVVSLNVSIIIITLKVSKRKAASRNLKIHFTGDVLNVWDSEIILTDVW